MLCRHLAAPNTRQHTAPHISHKPQQHKHSSPTTGMKGITPMLLWQSQLQQYTAVAAAGFGGTTLPLLHASSPCAPPAMLSMCSVYMDGWPVVAVLMICSRAVVGGVGKAGAEAAGTGAEGGSGPARGVQRVMAVSAFLALLLPGWAAAVGITHLPAAEARPRQAGRQELRQQTLNKLHHQPSLCLPEPTTTNRKKPSITGPTGILLVFFCTYGQNRVRVSRLCVPRESDGFLLEGQSHQQNAPSRAAQRRACAHGWQRSCSWR